jgi:hypothetical protein
MRLFALIVLMSPVGVLAQSVAVRAAGELLHVRVVGLGLLEGRVLQRLKDGRSVRVDFELTALEKPAGPPIAKGQHSFTLSLDLWEQRFAATFIGKPPRSMSHLTSLDAEAWCLDHVTLPMAALGRFGRQTPFWVRLDYRVHDRAAAPDPDDSTFTLRRLIDVLSRRQPDEDWGKTVEGGPFRLSK